MTLEWLRTVPSAVPDAIRMGDVGPVGWQVLLRERVLEPVWGDVAALAGHAVAPAVRAAAVRTLVPPRAVLGRGGAVWVHAAGPAPARFDVLVERRVRRPSPHPVRVPHECPLPPSDVVEVGGVRVTTVVRTGLDVARWLAPEQSAQLLSRLVGRAGLELGRLLPVVAGFPPRHRVRALLAVEHAARRAQSDRATAAPGDPDVQS